MKLLMGKEKIAIDDVAPFMESINGEKLAKLKEVGCNVFYVLLKPKEPLHVPAGFFLFEFVKKGVLIYGCRWSAMVRSTSQAQSYAELIGLHTNAGKTTTKMTRAYSCMSPPPDGA